jgi:hypothetical protein
MTRIHIEAKRQTWETPMANKVTDVAIALREAMEEFGWEFEREKSERIYSRFSVILPMPKVAYVFRFVVRTPLDDVVFDTWEMRMTHRGDISYLYIDNYIYDDLGTIRELLQELVERLPRRPWHFPLGQRMEAGLVIPEWSLSRKMWQEMGFNVAEKTPKDWIPRGTIGERMRLGLGLEDEEPEEDLEDLEGTGQEDEGRADHDKDEE